MISVNSLVAYRGRFAPTPSGPLHLGSLLTALASWLQARSRGGAWLLRIDDLDRPRCPPGMAAQILRQLEGHGLHWDEAPRHQAEHVDEYRSALRSLQQDGQLYHCTCTRAALKASWHPGPDGPVYTGTCRESGRTRGSLRLRLGSGRFCLDDDWQGRQCRELPGDIGDIVVQRADGQIAYPLASVIDERAQGITEVVRGVDLMGSTFQQRCIQGAMGLAPPACRHLPVLVDRQGRKLSKQNHAPAVEVPHAAANLCACLSLLNQWPPRELVHERPAEILRWASTHWRAARLSRTAQMDGTIAYNAVQQSPAKIP